MTEQLQVYKCGICGNIVEVLHPGAGELVCCGEPMTLQAERTDDVTTEKHVPWIQKTDDGVKVTVGQAALHPMEDKHFIEWIEIIVGGKAYRQFLSPGDAPEAVFAVSGDEITAREYCNVHGRGKGA